MKIGEMKFTPKLCDGVAYSGTVTIRPLSFDERLEMYESYGDGMPEDGPERSKFAIKIMRQIAKRSHEFVTECDIVRLSDGHKYTWEEVHYDADLTGLVIEVCNTILGKMKAGI